LRLNRGEGIITFKRRYVIITFTRK